MDGIVAHCSNCGSEFDEEAVKSMDDLCSVCGDIIDKRVILDEAFLSELRGAIARGWCYPQNQTKVMDVDLATAITIEVAKLVCPMLQKYNVALKLANSMLLSGERHTEQSKKIVNEALKYRKETTMGNQPKSDSLGKPETSEEATEPVAAEETAQPVESTEEAPEATAAVPDVGTPVAEEASEPVASETTETVTDDEATCKPVDAAEDVDDEEVTEEEPPEEDEDDYNEYPHTPRQLLLDDEDEDDY